MKDHVSAVGAPEVPRTSRSLADDERSGEGIAIPFGLSAKLTAEPKHEEGAKGARRPCGDWAGTPVKLDEPGSSRADDERAVETGAIQGPDQEEKRSPPNKSSGLGGRELDRRSTGGRMTWGEEGGAS